MTTFEQFQALSQQGYHRIPIISKVIADLETPLSIYLKLAHSQDNGKNTFLLESVIEGERFGRYSYIGLAANTYIKTQNGKTVLVRNNKIIDQTTSDPLAFISAFQAQLRVAPLPIAHRFAGGLAGYFAYDTIRFIEKKLQNTCPPDPLGLPDIYLLCCEQFAIIDNLTGQLHLVIYADPKKTNAYENAQQRLATLAERLRQPLPVEQPISSEPPTEVIRPFAKEDFLNAVNIAQEKIFSGELMQVQLGQRFIKTFKQPPITLYRTLRSLNPSPYMYYYNFDNEHYVVGSSPEILVRQDNEKTHKTITIRPLAGTRKRGGTPEEDHQLEQALLADSKEIAEHLMLIDLARNDIGRIAKAGSVQVTQQMQIEKYSHVQHIVSEVQGVLRQDCQPFDILRACFPAGTLSGAPKVRAMQLIDELEPVKRGLYGGAVGYLSFSGDIDLAIAIRTGLIYKDHLYVQAAAGIVADSDPEAEWQETENKAYALLKAAQWAESLNNAPQATHKNISNVHLELI